MIMLRLSVILVIKVYDERVTAASRKPLYRKSLAKGPIGPPYAFVKGVIEFIVLRPDYRLLLRASTVHIQINRTFLMNLTKKPHKFLAAFALLPAHLFSILLSPLTSSLILSRYKFYVLSFTLLLFLFSSIRLSLSLSFANF